MMSSDWRHMMRLSDDDRTACEVLDEMRTMTKSLNFINLKGAIEELQGMYQKMENALYVYKDALYGAQSLDRLRQEEKKLKDSTRLLQIEALKLHEGKLIYPKDSPEYNAYIYGLAKGYENAKKLLEEDTKDAKVSTD